MNTFIQMTSSLFFKNLLSTFVRNTAYNYLHMQKGGRIKQSHFFLVLKPRLPLSL